MIKAQRQDRWQVRDGGTPRYQRAVPVTEIARLNVNQPACPPQLVYRRMTVPAQNVIDTRRRGEWVC
jgi:hypothetical protein